jgi:hypothetical protein
MSTTPSNNIAYAALAVLLFVILTVGSGSLIAFVFHSIGG